MSAPSGVSEYLHQALLDRIRGFESILRDQVAAAAASAPGLRHALHLFKEYAHLLREELEWEFTSAPSDAVRMSVLASRNVHLKARIKFYNDFFRTGDGKIPQALADLIEEDVALFGGGSARAVVTIGSPDNFVTFTHDLRARLLDGLTSPPAGNPQPRLVLITVPESEGARISWLPITCGHELAHYLQRVKPIIRRHNVTLDPIKVAALPALPAAVGANPGSRVLEQIAANWLEELTCDAYAVHRFGAAAVAALTDFLLFVSPGSAASNSHPPRALRTRMMLHWLNSSGGDGLGIASTFEDLTTQDTSLPAWAVLLQEHFDEVSDDIWADVSDWCPRPSYRQPDYVRQITACRSSLESGVPPVQQSGTDGNELYSVSDLINALWMTFAVAPGVSVGNIALKALDLLDFVHRWRSAGGELLEISATPDSGPFESHGALSASEIRARLVATDESQLQLVPRLPPEVTDASVDLRLGNEFIVFARSNLGQFDALEPGRNPRAIQSRVRKPWGDVFFLHPGQMVLAATLEFLVMPPDLAGQVITRSSYGRLGLLSATAVQVHPKYSGCLTLELVNLGEVPMAITPGERVAQLMLWHTHAHTSDGAGIGKYQRPTGPEFSKIRSDRDADVLRGLRTAFAGTHTPLTS